MTRQLRIARARMMPTMQSAINPVTGDYTGEAIGHLGNAVWLRIKTELGSWWADPTLGSRIHLLKRNKVLPNVVQRARSYAVEALRPLIDSGRARSVDAVASMQGATLLLVVTVVDASGRREAYDFEWVI